MVIYLNFQQEEKNISLLMTDETRFHLNDFVNKQNFRYSVVENPTILNEKKITSTTRNCLVRNYVHWPILL